MLLQWFYDTPSSFAIPNGSTTPSVDLRLLSGSATLQYFYSTLLLLLPFPATPVIQRPSCATPGYSRRCKISASAVVLIRATQSTSTLQCLPRNLYHQYVSVKLFSSAEWQLLQRRTVLSSSLVSPVFGFSLQLLLTSAMSWVRDTSPNAAVLGQPSSP